MTDDDTPQKTITTSMAPVQALVIGTTGTGDGGTKRQLIETPEGQPDVVVNYISDGMALLIRFADTFLNTLITVMGVGGVTNLIPFTDFVGLVRTSAVIALTGAAIGFLKDAIVLVGKLKRKYPLLGAS